jgi:hypothetical protein
MHSESDIKIHTSLTTPCGERPMLGLCLPLQAGGPEELYTRLRRRPFRGTIL